MHIGRSSLSASRPFGFSTQDKKEVKKDDKKKTNSNVIWVPQKNKEESSAAERLTKAKENMQKRMASYQKRMESLEKLKAQVPYELQAVIGDDGEEKVVKVYTEENQELVNSLSAQQEEILSDIKKLTEDLNNIEKEIKTAMVEEQARKAEKEKKEKSQAPQNKNLTEAEKKQKEDMEQAEFIIQTDNVKKYIQDGRATKARLKQKEVRLKNEMASDITNRLFSEQRVRYAKDPINELPVPDTSLLSQKARIDSGRYMPDEKEGSEEIEKLQEAIKRVENSVNDKIGETHKNLEERKEEQEENRISDSSGQGEIPDRR